MLSHPEALRERDLHRYYRPWVDSQSLEDADGSGAKGLTYEGYRPQGSRDRSLTAFAQLAALRLDTRRAMVSLIDSRRQYILAEATRTVSLFSAAAERPEDEVWLGNAILNKTDAVCYHTFTATYGAKEDHGGTYDAACMVIPDCRLDPRFADKDYVTGEPGVRFYAGVPIITKAGHRIGVYAVSDEKPRDGLSAAEVRFMQDVAAAVMEHLELAKDSDDRIKGERMVCGLTDFIERSAQDTRGYSATKQTTMEKQTENARAAAADDDGESAAPPPPPTTKQAQRTRASESDPARIFQRAARIVRESTDADGVVFFDSSAAGIKFNHIHDSPAASSDESAAPTNTTDFDTGDSASSRRRRKRLVVSESPTAHASSQDRPCPVAGLSLRQGKGAVAHADFAFTESAMERYIRKYPVGKFFCYSEQGVGLNSSDERSQASETEQSDHTIFVTPGTQVKSRRKRTEKLVPTEFLKILPDVRTLIFLPLWDPASEIWIAGGFIWTTNASRLMSPEHELPYLQAFGNSITSEVARIGAQKADKAKTTFIASISHELRSPLHGILGSVEFLRDTVSSAYQESLVSSIETCGRTLLDTIDHVLDYAKINKLQSLASRKKGIGGRSKAAIAENTVLGVTIDFDLAQLVEEVCDTVCAGHTFRKTHNLSGGAFYDQAENKNVHQSDHKGPVEEGRDTHGSVLVSLIVAPYVTWVVRSQAGALRRIVMNLLGNSLKYTDSGHIAISMLQSNCTPEAIDLTLTVEDSGRGMSADYQRTKMFLPFSQEDPFTSGTGLGLSIVKQIVESLTGTIEVRSTVDVGSEIKVVIRLPCGQAENAKQDHALLRAPSVLKDMSVSIMTESDTKGGKRGLRTRESMLKACQNFNMTISEESDVNAKVSMPNVDFLLTDSPSLDQLLGKRIVGRMNRMPLSIVCICTDIAEKTAMENRLGQQMDALGLVAEIVTQPCGPRKLARASMACRNRILKQGSQKRLSLTRALTTHDLHQNPSLASRHMKECSMSDVFPEDPNNPHTAVPPRSQPLPSIITPSHDGATAPSSSAPRILLVDDNAINLRLLVVFAKQQNLHYTEAANGLQALNAYKDKANSSNPPSRPFDFILMDVSMPVMDGLTSTRQIRAFEKKSGLTRSHIVALTGLASGQDQQDAQDAGVDTYLVKPVKFADVKRLLEPK